MIKLCNFCNKTYETECNNSKFCNYKCYWASKIKVYPRICLNCGADFIAYPNHKDKKYCSKKCQYSHDIWRNKIGIINIGKNNGMWKGNKAKYGAIHYWVKRHKPKPEFCEECKEIPPHDLANISGEYKRDINDYKWLCRKCHMKEDGRLNEFIKNRIINNNLRDSKGRYCNKNAIMLFS